MKPTFGNPARYTRRDVLRALASAVAAPAAVMVLEASSAEAASARIEFRLVRGGFIVGAGGGRGALTFEGKRYRLTIRGVSLGATFGAASAEFVGRVRNLRKPSDIEGNYTAVGAGLAAAGGGGVARLRNSRGDELEVSGKQIGLMASVDLSGLRIRLARWAMYTAPNDINFENVSTGRLLEPGVVQRLIEELHAAFDGDVEGSVS